MIDTERLSLIEQAAKMYIKDNPTQLKNYDLMDLVNETVCVLLEGYAGQKIDGNARFSVKHAAERLSRVECQEMTGHDFTADEGSAPSGRRNTEDDYVSQIEVDDWIKTKLDPDQQYIVKHLMEGYTHEDIAAKVGFDRSTITRRIAVIQKIVKEDFDVN
jgi:DNA-directed RNA polymerase specialized sigma24 family protein